MAMEVKDFAIAIGRGRPTHFISKNKKIRIWHRRFGHVSNARVVKTSKLVDGIDLDRNKYNFTEVFIDSDTKDKNDTINLDNSFNLDFPCTAVKFIANATVTKQETPSSSNTFAFNQLYNPCIGSKLTSIVICNKPITPTKKKLEEVYADF